MKYIECCERYKDIIIQNFESAKCIKNFFNTEEIESIRLYQFQNAHRVKFQSTSSNIQSVVDISEMMLKMSWLKNKFENLFGINSFDHEHSGNFYITSQPHDCHVDLPGDSEEQNQWYNNLIPYKSVIIPLFLRHDTRAWTVFYKQRRIGYSVTFDRDQSSSQENSQYRIARVYDGLIDQFGASTDPERDYGQWTYDRYPHISRNNLRGFEEECVLEHKVGDIFVFDACQIHASVLHDGKSANWMKNGVNIQFYKTQEQATK